MEAMREIISVSRQFPGNSNQKPNLSMSTVSKITFLFLWNHPSKQRRWLVRHRRTVTIGFNSCNARIRIIILRQHDSPFILNLAFGQMNRLCCILLHVRHHSRFMLFQARVGCLPSRRPMCVLLWWPSTRPCHMLTMVDVPLPF